MLVLTETALIVRQVHSRQVMGCQQLKIARSVILVSFKAHQAHLQLKVVLYAKLVRFRQELECQLPKTVLFALQERFRLVLGC